jgi:single-strand DNA-binding protein
MAGYTMNTITVSGNLVRDPELRYMNNGNPVLNFAIAVNNRKKVGNDWQDDPCFIGVTVFGKQAETLGENLNKGSKVVVSGRIQQRSWEKDGQKRTLIEIVAEQIEPVARLDRSAGREPGGDDDVPF